jgi:uncharacterized protein with HEPN domain
MDNVKDDFYYVKRLLKSIEVTSRYLEGKSMDDLINDGYLCDAIENRFTKIAEDAKKLSDDYKKSIKNIPWDGIYSIRNRVCHDYDVVDYAILYKTIKVNFPQFKQVLLSSISTFQMNLYPDPFGLIKAGSKTVEMRLFDEKRRKLSVGGLIVFANTKTKEELIAEIVELKQFDSFESLYVDYKKTDLGYKDDELAKPEDMLAYYSTEEIKKYGVVAIELKAY